MMHGGSVRRLQAVILAAGLVGWSFITPRIRTPWRTSAQTGAGTLLVHVTRTKTGLRPPPLWSGLRAGLPVAATAAGAVAVGATLPPVRAAMATRELSESPVSWLALRIPLGTVWAEEAGFRAALATVAADGFGPTAGRLLQAAAFGLSHIADARATDAPVLPTVLVTGAAGWLFGWLADRSGSLAAPMLAHLAINESGAVAVLAAQRRPIP